MQNGKNPRFLKAMLFLLVSGMLAGLTGCSKPGIDSGSLDLEGKVVAISDDKPVLKAEDGTVEQIPDNVAIVGFDPFAADIFDKANEIRESEEKNIHRKRIPLR